LYLICIEFCLSINSTFFLFTEIFALFKEHQLEQHFIKNLEPFILGGQLKKEHVPSDIIQRVIAFYEEQNDYKGLERVVQQLDFTDYPNKVDLIVTCEQNCLISALLYLMSSQSSEEVAFLFS
jgi:Golgi CORVET complex core vacuolar protein 8